MSSSYTSLLFFFFNDPSTTDIYTLSLHDALPISRDGGFYLLGVKECPEGILDQIQWSHPQTYTDRKSTRLNSSHVAISYAVFCLKKKKTNKQHTHSYSRIQHYKTICTT